MHSSLAAFKYRNYRLWFLGQLVSLFGSWMQITAQGFLVFDLTHSSAYLGYVAFVSGIPSWLFMLYGGVLADRISKRTLLILAQTAMMLFAFILAALTFFHVVQAWHIMILSFLLGIAAAFDAPARQAFVLDLVDRKDMLNAIAHNSTMFNAAAVIGPAFAGIAYAAFGPEWCFMINGISFLAIIVALLMMKVAVVANAHKKSSSTLSDLKEGFRYVLSDRALQTPIMLVAALSLFGLSFATILPAWSVQILNGDAKIAGFLQATRGVGAMLGAVSIAFAGQIVFKGKIISRESVVFSVFLLFFSFTRNLTFGIVALMGVGYFSMRVLNLANALLQAKVSDAMRGRVMAIHSLSFFGLMPIGGIFIGVAAHLVSEPFAVGVSAVCFFVLLLGILAISPQLYLADNPK